MVDSHFDPMEEEDESKTEPVGGSNDDPWWYYWNYSRFETDLNLEVSSKSFINSHLE